MGYLTLTTPGLNLSVPLPISSQAPDITRIRATAAATTLKGDIYSLYLEAETPIILPLRPRYIPRFLLDTMGITLRTLLTVAVSATLGLAYPAEPPAPAPAAVPCTTGSPVVTAGYTINYAPAVPTIAFQQGYQPEPAWSEGHVVGTSVSFLFLFFFSSPRSSRRASAVWLT